MKDKVLVTLLAGHEIGRVTESNGRLRFVYDDDWRSAPDAFPLSLSMPLTVREHDDQVVSAFLWGLLPDNQQILDAWGRRFQVSPRNCFSLLAYVGEDCAGAVQFAAPERAGELTSQGSVDLCQALGVFPTLKYQNEGGPAPRDVVSLLRKHSSRAVDDITTFVQALAFNWLIAGTDAHARNYSLLHGPRQRVRLAPLYDVASVLPYPEYSERHAKLAMKIGSSYRLHEIARGDWEKLAQEFGLDAAPLLAEIAELARRIGDSALDVQRSLTAAGLEHPMLERLTTAINARARSCLRSLGI